MTGQQLRELAAAWAASSPGRWVEDRDGIGDGTGDIDIVRTDAGVVADAWDPAPRDAHDLDAVHVQSRANARFIALAHELVPLLLAEVNQLREDRRELDSLLSVLGAEIGDLLEPGWYRPVETVAVTGAVL